MALKEAATEKQVRVDASNYETLAISDNASLRKHRRAPSRKNDAHEFLVPDVPYRTSVESASSRRDSPASRSRV